ncbi:MAG: short-chain dehydrogenase [Acidobacteria bacterium]|nr:MAG: short-chain dehydrogenase [Acidobacteriota bacterium]
MQIEGKHVLVTGASRGLGRALTFAFANAGATQVLAGTRKKEDEETLKAEAERLGVNVTPVHLDVRSDEDVNAAAALGGIDILVNNAGVAGYGDPTTMDFNSIQEEIEVNYLGTLRMVRAFAPAMIEQQEGAIVNIATAFAKINLPLIGTYCATKAALLSLGQALRAYLSPHGIFVMTVLPTTIDTDMSRGADVPKMGTEFVAGEILEAVREEKYDPPIGDEAHRVIEGVAKDAVGFEKMLSQYRA